MTEIPEHARSWFAGMVVDLPVGSVLEDTKTGRRREVLFGVAEGGGYYGTRDLVTGEDGLLHPGYIGGRYVVVSRPGVVD